MKTLHLNQYLSFRGGVEVYLLGLLDRMIEMGADVHVGHGDDAPVVSPMLEGRCHQLSELAVATSFGGPDCVRALLERLRPDIVHVHQLFDPGALEAALSLAPVVLHGHDFRYLCPSSSFFRQDSMTVCAHRPGIACAARTFADRCMSRHPASAISQLRRIERISALKDRFAGVVVPSEAAASRFCEAGFNPSRVRIVPYFCPVPVAAEPRPLPDRRRILFLGRVRPYKGIDAFVKLLGALPDDVEGTVVGDMPGNMRPHLEALAQRSGCAERLELRAWADRGEITELMRQASIFVFPSLWPETMGIVGVEALAQGVPVVAHDIGGVREWLVPGVTGELVGCGDFDGLVRATRELLDAPERLQRMGDEGLYLASTKFSVDRHTTALLDAYSAFGLSTSAAS